MTKEQFTELRVGDVVEVIDALFGYSPGVDGKLSTSAGCGPWIGKITHKNDEAAVIEYRLDTHSKATGLVVYPQVVGKVWATWSDGLPINRVRGR